jgi:hypothetical protein
LKTINEQDGDRKHKTMRLSPLLSWKEKWLDRKMRLSRFKFCLNQELE